MKFLYSLSLSFFVFFTISSAQDNRDSLKTYNLGEVIVTSQRSNIIKSSSVFDVPLDKIESLNGTDISKVLITEAGTYISTNSKNETKIYMRGFDQRDISIFIDGVPVYQPYDGMVDLSNLPVNTIEKITVSKGMPSLLYGANAMGGTINLISKKSNSPFAADIDLEAGTANKGALGFNGAIKNFNYSLNGTWSQSDGFKLPKSFPGTKNENGGVRENSQYTNRGGMLKLGLDDFYNFNLAYTLMLVDNEKGIPVDIYTARPRYWRFSEWKKTVNNLMFASNLSDIFAVRGNLFYESFFNVLDSYDDATFTTQKKPFAFRSTYDDHTAGANLTASADLSHAGLTRLSFSYKKDVHKEEGNFNEGFKKYEADNFSLSAEQDLRLAENIFMIAGAGFNFLNPVYSNGNPLRSSNSIFNGNLGINFNPDEIISLHANLAMKSRFPTLKEFYSETKGKYVSNPDLEPEQSLNMETGAAIKYFNQNNLGLTIFYSSVKNLIQEAPVAGGLKQFQNIGKAVLSGIELTADYKSENFKIDFNYTYLYAKNKSDNAFTDALAYRPEQTASLVPEYIFDFGLTAGGELIYIGKKYGTNLDMSTLVSMPDFILLNLRLSQKIFGHYTIYARVNNVFDKYCETEYGFPQAGRELIFGVRINH